MNLIPQNLHTKICIIGAGPAGATVSLFLGKMHIKHMILDAAVFPRDKVCGDALDLTVMRVLNHLDPYLVKNEILKNDNYIKAWGANIIISKHKKNIFDVGASNSNYPFFLVSKRAYFDNFLISKINNNCADFRQGTKVKKVVRKEDKWIIFAQHQGGALEIHADFIVGADGDHSAVLRSLGERKINRQHYGGALRQYWKGISDMNANNHLEVYLPKSLPLAYLWIFPLPNGEANVGCGLVSELIAKRNIDLKKLFHQLITEDPAIAHRFLNAKPLEKAVGWGLPFASHKRPVYGDGFLLTGDAAGMICPTTGEGIGPAMISGYVAAQFINRAIKANRFDKSMFTNYDREIYKRLQSDIKKYNLVRLLSPGLYNSLINLFSGMGVAHYYFNRNIGRWIETAISKPIEVNM